MTSRNKQSAGHCELIPDQMFQARGPRAVDVSSSHRAPPLLTADELVGTEAAVATALRSDSPARVLQAGASSGVAVPSAGDRPRRVTGANGA